MPITINQNVLKVRDGNNYISIDAATDASTSERLAAIEAKGTEVIGSIPADYSDLVAAISSAYSSSKTYAVGDYTWYDGDLYRCITTISTAEAWTAAHWTKVVLTGDMADVKSAKMNAYSEAQYSIENKRINCDPGSASDGSIVTSNGCACTDFIACKAGDKIEAYGVSFWYQGHAAMYLIAFYGANKVLISGITQIDGSSATTSQIGKASTTAPQNCAYVRLSTNIGATPYGHIFNIDISETKVYADAANAIAPVNRQIITAPELTNGSGGNTANGNGVTARAVPFVNNAQRIAFKCNRSVSASGNYYKYDVSAFKGTAWYTNKLTDLIPDENGEIVFDCATVINNVSGVDGFGVTIWEYNSSDVLQTLRISDFSAGDIIVRYIYPDAIQTNREIENDEINKIILDAQHNKGNAGAPLTILHFSDLHADTSALKRILSDVTTYGNKINEKICTGDIVSNAAEQISSWWPSDVMTCIGNHDTASYSGGIYDWTALSMANRDAYYIAPFESNWGITHTSGTSYYYKDFSTQKVRLIIMDGMLYTGTQGEEATAQTSWLEGLLSDAITNNLHVLIAIHAPHGGAVAEDCSFSRYGQDAMPTYTDCNTPQTVIDAVASAITGGLKFIGYICGHMHQDNIWDAENDGTQLMYCITCASTVTNQWKNSDQYRDKDNDAFNIITIDTTNTLIKIVRGGGANIDDHMRTRKAICFDYSTGTKVGEVL